MRNSLRGSAPSLVDVPEPGVGVIACDPVVLRTDRIVRVPVVDRLVPLIRLQIGLAIIVLNLADVLLTKAILARGGVEGNPLMRGMMAGFAAPIGTKLVFSALAGVLLVMCPASSKLADRAAATVAGIYVAIVLWNVALLGYLIL